jgi:hypothetical protein
MDKSLLHDFALSARELLMQEAGEHLESVYGLTSDGKFESLDRLPNLRTDSFATDSRKHLELFFTDEVAAGLTKKEVYEKLTKEITFTWLNRIVAIAMMEHRGIIHHEAIGKGIESNGFKRWLASPGNTEMLNLFNKGDLPKNIFGEGPRDKAYREFLFWQCNEIARELAVLFDTTTLASRIFPRPRVFQKIVEKVNAPEIQSSWKAGNEEAIGWIYQYFNEKEKAEVFDRLYKKKQKIRPQDIPAATCLYTPRWIVKYLIQNTLGRQWMQMHPDSSLAASLDYLVPLKGEIPLVDLKPVREITLLDPACGTMHFGLVAFDLYTKMYEEELQKAGTARWPISPSVKTADEIPAAILANNIHGIDIDLRAVQLSALTLFLKAKGYRKDAKITESNLACADILPLDGEHLAAFLKETKLTDPLYERILKALIDQLKLAHHLGSLLKIEEEITRLIADEKKRFEKVGRQVDLAGKSVVGVGADAFDDAYWERLEGEIITSLNAFAQRQREKGRDESYFVGETTKGIRLLELLRQKYDVVVTNPPYSWHRNMNNLLRQSLKNLYKKNSDDLYSAFILRSMNLLKTDGRCGIITIHSFMFLSSFEQLRNEILNTFLIETASHLGTQTEFDLSNPNAQGFVSIILRKDEKAMKYGEINEGVWFRLTQSQGTDKRTLLENAIIKFENNTYFCKQNNFKKIPGLPFLYWISKDIRKTFIDLKSLGKVGITVVGNFSCDNVRFLRYWWEVGVQSIKFNCHSRAEVTKNKEKWYPHMKGGEYCPWYGNQDFVINYLDDGNEIREYRKSVGQSFSLPGQDYYFNQGITYTHLTTSKFNARYLPSGFSFDVTGPFVRADNIFLVLAVFNSKIGYYFLNLINPTVSYPPGDVAKLPIPSASNTTVSLLVETAINYAKINCAEDETTFNFTVPSFALNIDQIIMTLLARYNQLKTVESQIDNEIFRLYKITPKDQAAIESDVGPSPELSISTHKEIAARWVGYAMGIVMGRFSPGTEGALGSAIIDGKHTFSPQTEAALKDLAYQYPIGILDPADPDDLAIRINKALNLMLGESCTNEIIEVIGGGSDQAEETLRSYLKKEFWKLHLQWYRKRPIYWLFQTPKKYWSVYLFHERLTSDTLFLLKGNRYLAAKMNATRQKITELHTALKTAEGKERKRLEKDLAEQEDLFADLEAFEKNLMAVLEKTNERGEVVGWKPELDDGVILNLAPLCELMPSWRAEPEKFWKELEDEEYDWSYTAMRYWPDRVLEKCKTNKSFAIAHDRLDIYKGG